LCAIATFGGAGRLQDDVQLLAGLGCDRCHIEFHVIAASEFNRAPGLG